MARPRKDEGVKRKNKVMVYMSDVELFALREKAQAVGMSISAYLRVLGLKVGFYSEGA